MSQDSDNEDETKHQTVSSDNKAKCDVENTETKDQSISDSNLTNQTQEAEENSDCVTKSVDFSAKSNENADNQSDNESENVLSANA